MLFSVILLFKLYIILFLFRNSLYYFYKYGFIKKLKYIFIIIKIYKLVVSFVKGFFFFCYKRVLLLNKR